MHSPAGQTAIRLRRALAEGRGADAAGLLPGLDEDHVVEILLGAALRDAREGFASARFFVALAGTPLDAPGWQLLCEGLATAGDTGPDDLAAAWVASGQVPDDIGPAAATFGEAFGPGREATLVARIARGDPLGTLLAEYATHPLFPAVEAYYRGGIRAMGWRPLLILAITAPTADDDR